MLKQNLIGKADKLKNGLGNLRKEFEKVIFKKNADKPFGDIKLPLENVNLDFSSELTSEHNRAEFKQLYPDFADALAHEFKHLNFKEIIKNEYQQESELYARKTLKIVAVRKRLDWLRKVQAEEWWNEVRGKTHKQDHHLLEKGKNEIQELIKNQGIYLVLSTVTLKAIHERYLHILSQITCESKEAEKIQNELSPATLAKWKHYLTNLKKMLETEVEKINTIVFNRINDTSPYRTALSEDNAIYLHNQKIEYDKNYESIKKLLATPFKPKIDESSIKTRENKKIVKYDDLLTNELPRNGLTRETFRYFYPYLPAGGTKKYVEAFMPPSIMQHVQASGLWETLPRFLTSGRRIRANFIVDQLYDIIDLSIKTNHFNKHHLADVVKLDDPANPKFLKASINLENKYQQLIDKVKNGKPRGVWAYFFKRETKQLFDEYETFLKAEKAKISKNIDTFIDKLNDVASRDQKIVINDMESVAQIRDFFKLNNITDNKFLQRTDLIDELINELLTPEISVIGINKFKRKLLEPKINELVTHMASFTRSEEQHKAILLLQKIILDQPINPLEIGNIKNSLLPVVKKQEDFPNFLKKFLGCHIEPRSTGRINNLIMALNQGWNKIPQDHREEIYEGLALLSQQQTYLGKISSINYLQNFIDIIKKHLISSPPDQLTDHFANLINQTNNSELEFLYQVKLSKTNLVNLEGIEEFIANTKLIKIPVLPLSNHDMDVLFNIVGPYRDDWHPQQIRLLQSFATPKHIQNYHTEWLQAILNYTINDNDNLIKSPLSKPHSVEELLSLYGKENFIKIIQSFESSLNQAIHPKLFNIIRTYLPLGMEEILAANDPKLAEQIHTIRERLIDKECYYKIKDLLSSGKNDLDFKTQFKALITEMKITGKNYPLTADGRKELNELIGSYQLLACEQQAYLYNNLGFGDEETKKNFYTAWMQDQFFKDSKKIIDILPHNPTAAEIKSMYKGKDNFFYHLYSQIQKHIEAPSIPADVLLLIQKHLPVGIADEFKDEPLIQSLIVSCQSQLDETIFLSKLANICSSHKTIDEISTFIQEVSHQPHSIDSTDGLLKWKKVIEENVLPYDDKWAEQQLLLLKSFAPQYVPQYYRQWLTGLVTGEHHNISSNPVLKATKFDDIKVYYGKSEFISQIIPLFYQYLKTNKGIPKEIFNIIKHYLPDDIKAHYSKGELKPVKKMLTRINKKLKKVVIIDGEDSDYNAALISIRTSQLLKKNANMAKSVEELKNFIKTVTPGSFPKSHLGRQAFNGIIKFAEKLNHVIFDEKWGRQQKVLIEAYTPEYLPSFHSQWLLQILAGNTDYDDLNPLPKNPTIDDLESIYGKENLPELLTKIRDYLNDKVNRDDKLISFLALHLPDRIEDKYPDLGLGQVKRTLSDLVSINQLKDLIYHKKSQRDVSLFIDSIKQNYPQQFQIPRENDDLFIAVLSTFQPNWACQQKLVLSSFKIGEEQLTRFNRDWLKGLLKGEHCHFDISPIDDKNSNQLLQAYGFLNNPNGFIDLFSADIYQCIKNHPQDELLKLIEAHLAGLDDTDEVKKIRAEIQLYHQKISVKEQALKFLEDYKHCSLTTKVELLENQLTLHQKIEVQMKYEVIKTALEIVSSDTVQQFENAILKPDQATVKKIYDQVVNPKFSTAHFSSKEKILSLYENWQKIPESWSKLQNHLQEIDNFRKSTQSEFSFLVNHDSIHVELFEYLDKVPKSQREVASKLIANNELKFDEILPLNNYYKAISDRLNSGISFEASKDWHYITYYEDFKLIIEYIVSINKHTDFRLDLNNPEDKQSFDKSLNNLLLGPYTFSLHRNYWESLFAQYLMKENVWPKDKNVINKLQPLEKLIDLMGSPEQRLSFPSKDKDINKTLKHTNRNAQVIKKLKKVSIKPRKLKMVLTQSIFHKPKMQIKNALENSKIHIPKK